jgi:hypothetical protein
VPLFPSSVAWCGLDDVINWVALSISISLNKSRQLMEQLIQKFALLRWNFVKKIMKKCKNIDMIVPN